MREWYRAYRRWTDRDLARHGRPASLYLPLAALIAATLIFRPSPEAGAVFLLVAGSVFLPWQAWVVWRVVHMMRVADYVASRRYAAEGRFKLPKEYHETEFASARARRLRRQRT